ncbi:MAG: DUF4442 domain-containing protein [Nitrospiria bacterium]
MAESFKSRLMRWKINCFPCYFFTGARITYIADDFQEAHIRLPLTWRTRNIVGTIFGGSMYASIDPVYMVMLIKILGSDYIVWDKAAAIQFKKTGRTTLRARFHLTPEEIETIRNLTAKTYSIDRVYSIDLIDADGQVCATVEKTLYIRRKDAVRK